jgi:mRNA interferase HigB
LTGIEGQKFFGISIIRLARLTESGKIILLPKGDKMELRGQLIIDEFIKQYPRSEAPLNKWVKEVRAAHWKNFAQLRQTFPSADYVAPYVVFNIGGNKFRMVALVVFNEERATVIKIMTHSQYNRWKP